MELRVDPLHDRPPSAHRRAVAIGNFDGVHLGHRRLLDACIEAGRRLGLFPTVLTFDPHPASVVSDRGAPPRIQTPSSRRRALREAGVEELATLTFDLDTARLSPAAFVDGALCESLRAGAVVVGHGFRFGAGRVGDVAALRDLSAGRFEVVEVPSLEDGGGRISSSRIREALASADLAATERLIGRAYEIEGAVVHGDGRGRKIGFPTANVETGGLSALSPGVYVADGLLPDDSAPRRAAVNFGMRPTFDGVVPSLEAHFPGFSGDLYGKVVRLRVLERLRPEQRFGSADELILQVGADVRSALEFPERPWPR